MMIVELDEAQWNLDRLIEQACAGEKVVIAVESQPRVRLVPIMQSMGKRVFGSMKGKISLTPEFFEPLPDDALDAWGQ